MHSKSPDWTFREVCSCNMAKMWDGMCLIVQSISLSNLKKSPAYAAPVSFYYSYSTQRNLHIKEAEELLQCLFLFG